MATMNDYSTADLLRIFLLKFLNQADLDAANPDLGKFLDGTTGKIEVDTTL